LREGCTGSASAAAGDGSEAAPMIVDGGGAPEGSADMNVTVRHRRCLRVYCSQMAVFAGGMCAYCASIPALEDFRGRVTRILRGDNDQFTNLR
jgi:hypothetical protein